MTRTELGQTEPPAAVRPRESRRFRLVRTAAFALAIIVVIASILLIAAMIGAIVLVRASEPAEAAAVDRPAMDVVDEVRRENQAPVATGTEVDVGVGGP